MRVLIQRVSEASVKIEGKINGQIEQGLLVLIGICNEDTAEDINWVIKKISNLRIFDDESGQMNLSIQDVKGELLLISQFTLHASTKKGNRPSYIKAAKPDIALPIYHKLISEFRNQTQLKVETGEFGADMKVGLINDGPVTIMMDSKHKE